MKAVCNALCVAMLFFATLPARPQAEETLAFDVASVREADPSKPGEPLISYGTDRFTSGNASLKMLMGFAYEVRNFQIAGGPGWANTTGFDIDARVEGVPPAPAENMRRKRLMARSLLRERFKLTFHREMRPQTVYRLLVARGGPTMKAVPEDSPLGPVRLGTSQITGKSTTVASLAMFLRARLEAKVIDETSLTGKFDFDLRWAPEGTEVRDDGAPSLVTALREQLGLRLEASKEPVEVLVIDRAEKPSGN